MLNKGLSTVNLDLNFEMLVLCLMFVVLLCNVDRHSRRINTMDLTRIMFVAVVDRNDRMSSSGVTQFSIAPAR